MSKYWRDCYTCFYYLLDHGWLYIHMLHVYVCIYWFRFHLNVTIVISYIQLKCIYYSEVGPNMTMDHISTIPWALYRSHLPAKWGVSRSVSSYTQYTMNYTYTHKRNPRTLNIFLVGLDSIYDIMMYIIYICIYDIFKKE